MLGWAHSFSPIKFFVHLIDRQTKRERERHKDLTKKKGSSLRKEVKVDPSRDTGLGF